jgi:hypothetical protein
MKPGSYTRTPEIRKKCSESAKGRKASPEARLKQSLARLGKKMPPRSEQWKERQRIAKAGKKLSVEHRRKIGAGVSGERSSFWRGGICPENLRIRSSMEIKEWRKAVFERDSYTCVWCGDSRGGNLQADHIKPFSRYPELRFELSNGRTLCIPCHKKTDTYGNKAKQL